VNSRFKQQLIRDAEAVIARHPTLSIKWKDEYPVKIFGSFIVEDDQGQPQGYFDIEVQVPAAYPYAFPTLKETSEKILPRTQDRHIDVNGVICYENPRTLELSRHQGITLIDFFRRYVQPFFCWQLLYDMEGPGELGSWSHGTKGIKEFYEDKLRTNDEQEIRTILSAMVKHSVPSRNASCICGSDKKYKRCHMKLIQELSKLSVATVAQDLKLFDGGVE
jgi:SEC-C motif